ncbi:hypothetical protein PS1_006716 [Malus domestica]
MISSPDEQSPSLTLNLRPHGQSNPPFRPLSQNPKAGVPNHPNHLPYTKLYAPPPIPSSAPLAPAPSTSLLALRNPSSHLGNLQYSSRLVNGHIVNGIFLHQEAALDCPSSHQTQDLGLGGNGGLPCSNGMVSPDGVHPQDICSDSGLNLHPFPNVGPYILTKSPTISHLLQKVQSYPPLQKDNSHSHDGFCTSVSRPENPIFQEPGLVTSLIATPHVLVVSPKGRYSDAICGNGTRLTGPLNLHYCQPKVVGNRKVVCPPITVAAEAAKEWRHCLVGYFIDKKLPFSAVCILAKKLWANKGLVDVLAKDSGFFFFKFRDDSSCVSVLESGPWHLSGRMLVITRWRLGMVLSKASHVKVPIWVKFFNVPLEHWNHEGFCHIASAVGKPLHVDSLTESKKRISFMRICVEVDASVPLIDSFDLVVQPEEEGEIPVSVEVNVEYQCRPRLCLHCKTFGHYESACPHTPKLATSETPTKPTSVIPPPLPKEPHQLPDCSNTFKTPKKKGHNKGMVIFPTTTSGTQPQLLPSSPKVISLPSEDDMAVSNSFEALDRLEITSDSEIQATASPDTSRWLSRILGRNVDALPSKGLRQKKKKKKNSKSKNAPIKVVGKGISAQASPPSDRND